MSDIKSVLKLTDCENMEEQFKQLSNNLMKNWCIKQGDVTFYFLEIELYYYSDKHQDTKIADGSSFVYQRNCSRPGVFLLHDSGVDICLENNEKDASFGGLLLRSLLRKDSKNQYTIVTGPWDCCDALFNYVDETNFPRLFSLEDKPFDCNVAYAPRCNVKDKAKFANRMYCAYAKDFPGYSEDMSKPWGVDRYDPVRVPRKRSKYTAVPWNRK